MRLSRLALLLILPLWVTISQAEERTELHLFQYGRTNTDSLKTAFFDFRDMLAEKLPMLSAELSQEIRNPAITHLKLTPVVDENGVLLRPETLVGSLDAKRNYWLQTGALSVLTGHVRQQGTIPFVYTTFFWGDLKGPYPVEMITLQLPVVGESFDSTYDSHSVAVLYALAQAIKKNCNNSAEILYLLSEAHKRAKATASDLPVLGAELETLVVAAIDEIRGDCND